MSECFPLSSHSWEAHRSISQLRSQHALVLTVYFFPYTFQCAPRGKPSAPIVLFSLTLVQGQKINYWSSSTSCLESRLWIEIWWQLLFRRLAHSCWLLRLYFSIKNPLIVIILIRLNFNRQLNCLLFCSTHLPSADLNLALEWYHSSPWQRGFFRLTYDHVSFLLAKDHFHCSSFQEKKSAHSNLIVFSILFWTSFHKPCSYLMTPGNHSACPTCAYHKNATSSDGWLALASAFGEGTHYFGAEECSCTVISGHFHWLWVRRLF